MLLYHVLGALNLFQLIILYSNLQLLYSNLQHSKTLQRKKTKENTKETEDAIAT